MFCEAIRVSHEHRGGSTYESAAAEADGFHLSALSLAASVV